MASRWKVDPVFSAYLYMITEQRERRNETNPATRSCVMRMRSAISGGHDSRPHRHFSLRSPYYRYITIHTQVHAPFKT